MNKNKLIEFKKRLLAMKLDDVKVGTAGYSVDKIVDGIPTPVPIFSKYSNVESYYKYVIQNGKAEKLYNSSNVYLLFNKETYEVTEYIFSSKKVLGGLGTRVELYDLLSENMLAYFDGVTITYNKEYYKYLIENNYQVCLKDANHYIEGHFSKKYYSFDEIKEIESQIADSLKIINSAKTKTKRLISTND